MWLNERITSFVIWMRTGSTYSPVAHCQRSCCCMVPCHSLILGAYLRQNRAAVQDRRVVRDANRLHFWYIIANVCLNRFLLLRFDEFAFWLTHFCTSMLGEKLPKISRSGFWVDMMDQLFHVQIVANRFLHVLEPLWADKKWGDKKNPLLNREMAIFIVQNSPFWPNIPS